MNNDFFQKDSKHDGVISTIIKKLEAIEKFVREHTSFQHIYTTPVVSTFVPTVTAAAGTFTTVSATCDYVQYGRLVHFSIEITITNQGTASGALIATLPITPSIRSVAVGRERAVTGNELQGIIPAGGSLSILTYNNASPIGNGYIINVSGTYFA